MMNMDNVLNEAGLNRSQKKFVKSNVNRSSRVLAPAGSGKTFSLLWRCKYLTEIAAENETPKPKFLIVTFTKSAKFELESRINNQPEFKEIDAEICTLNAWGWKHFKRPGAKLVASSIERNGLILHSLLPICSKYPTISEMVSGNKKTFIASDLIDLIDNFKSIGFKHTMNKSEFNSHIKYLNTICLTCGMNNCVDSICNLWNCFPSDKPARNAAMDEFFGFWKKASVELQKMNYFTFEDQKYFARMELDKAITSGERTNEAIYSHIFIDEFQDINPLDLELIKDISIYYGSKKPLPITIVGDDDQAIFGWRNTTPEFILNPEKYFNVKFDTFVLDTNYRSPKAIVELSQNLISNNKNRVPKNIKSVAKGKAFVKAEYKKNSVASIDYVVKLIDTLVNKKGCSNVAIIGRKHASLFPYQVILSSQKIKYNVDADLDIFDGEAMNSLIEILKIFYKAKNDDNDNPAEDILFICNKMNKFKLNAQDNSKLKQYLYKYEPSSFKEAMEALYEYSEKTEDKAHNAYHVLEQLYSATSVYSLMKKITELLRGFDKDFWKIDIDNHYKSPQFLLLAELSKKYKNDIKAFYKDLEKAKRTSENSRKRNNDDTGAGYKENADIKIHLLTATRSKGHEFDAVIIIDSIEDEWPHKGDPNETEFEDERRLFYVAMTRAKKYLYFVIPSLPESRFLREAKII